MGNNKQPSINDFLNKEEQQQIYNNMQKPVSFKEQFERSQKLNNGTDLERAVATPLDTKKSNCTIYGVIERFLRWAFRLLQKYNRGAKANHFPIAEYGILGEKKRGGNAL